MSFEKSQFTYESLHFKQLDDVLRVFLYNIFYFDIPLDEVKNIAEFIILTKNKNSDTIEFKAKERRAGGKLSNLISKYLPNLKNSINKKNAVYIHQNMSVPLIGNGSFGIIDRGTNLIEIKPITSCNLDCIYCSINEPRRSNDFVIEYQYLVFELEQLIKIKESKEIEIHIGCQGEPLLYAPLREMISDISKNRRIKRISMDTNAVLITKKKADELIKAGLTQFNISIDSLDKEKSRKLANSVYNIDNIKKITEYISKKCDVLIAPVIIPGYNEDDVIPIIEFAKQLQNNTEFKVKLGFQKFLNYNFGKNPVKEETWNDFNKRLKKLEEKYDVKLLLTAQDFGIVKDNELVKPFKKNDVVKADIVFNGRMKGEKIAVANNRTISIAKCDKKGSVKIKILRTKHNIYFGIAN